MGTKTTGFHRAILLRSVDYREADRIITLLTDGVGRVDVIARGARRSRKRFLGVLEPFSVINVELRVERDKLGQLLQADVVQAFPSILQDLKKMEIGGALFELLRFATPDHQTDLPLFDEVLGFLTVLDQNEMQVQEIFICFQMRLMGVLGFAPRFDICGKCGKIPSETQSALFDPILGHLVCQKCGGAKYYLSAAARRRLIAALGKDWQHISVPLNSKQLQEAENIVTPFIESRVERKLNRRPSSSGHAR